jgi:transcriptional regulator with XRE-family HTH domain
LPPVDIAAQFGDNLARCRKRADLSQDELSVRASVHRTEISQLERGGGGARRAPRSQLALALEVSADELLAGIDWVPGDTRIGRFSASGERAA